MTDLLVELIALDAAATPGPWKVYARDQWAKPSVQRGDEGGFAVIGRSEAREDSDANIIAALRNHLPEIIAQLTAAKAEREDAERLATALRPFVFTLQKTCERTPVVPEIAKEMLRGGQDALVFHDSRTKTTGAQ